MEIVNDLRDSSAVLSCNDHNIGALIHADRWCFVLLFSPGGVNSRYGNPNKSIF